jgi:hypothetical protein
MNEDERNYYTQLHETARIYQAQIWAVPAVFFAFQGVVFFAFDFNLLLTFKNALILLANGIISYLLLLIFMKTYLLELLIQTRINAIDDEINQNLSNDNERFRRIPLYSLQPGRFLHELENSNIVTEEYQRQAIVTRAGNRFSLSMRSVSYISLILSILISIILIYKIWPLIP